MPTGAEDSSIPWIKGKRMKAVFRLPQNPPHELGRKVLTRANGDEGKRPQVSLSDPLRNSRIWKRPLPKLPDLEERAVRKSELEEAVPAVRAWWEASRDRIRFDENAGEWRLKSD